MAPFFGRGKAEGKPKVSDANRTSEVKLAPPADYKLQQPRATHADDQENVDALRAFLDQHRAENPPPESYAPFEKIWASEEDMYRRYMRAAKGDMRNARKRILDTLQWRREFRPDIIPPDEVAPEGETGKHVLTGFDRNGRPILYLRPGRENTKTSPRQIRYLVWSLERAIDLMPPGQGTMTIIVDFHGSSLSSTPSLGTARHVAHILQNHYVERLGRAFVCNTPRFISAFFTGLSPFLDPITKDKIRFNEPDMTSFIHPDQLDMQFPGGTYAYDFEFKAYWGALVEQCGILPDGRRKKTVEAIENGKV
ncbi:4-nitrophenylphosphatase [Malassezia cuniculi]|uniref:4-nitrophenylphosphatase n=1 Tax=Malassezia cuniculi TaxID=948313 RepID=A0AAF0J5C7_9BASI|nr:4-nitrophenylphosphatase [Malassezia cuniculi]